MKALAAYIMKGRAQAIAVAAGFAVVSLIFPLLGLLSGAAVGLITLRSGPAAGLLLTVATTVLVSAIALLTGTPLLLPTIVSIIVLLLLVWLACSILRYTRSLPQSITAVSIAGMLFVAVFHLSVGDPAVWWQSHLDEFFAQATESMMMDQQVVFKQNLETWSEIMTGFVTMAFLPRAISRA